MRHSDLIIYATALLTLQLTTAEPTPERTLTTEIGLKYPRLGLLQPNTTFLGQTPDAPGCKCITAKNTTQNGTAKCVGCPDGCWLEKPQEKPARCSNCVKNCAKCKSLKYCEDCDSGYFHTMSLSNCEKCQTTNCQTCQPPGETCSTCMPGYWIQNNKCLRCTAHCLTCQDATSCSKCADNFDYDVNSQSCVWKGGVLFQYILYGLVAVIVVVLICVAVCWLRKGQEDFEEDYGTMGGRSTQKGNFYNPEQGNGGEGQQE